MFRHMRRGYAIRPITNSTDLYLEGKSMHHCVNSYVNDVATGERFIFSVTKGGEHVATLELCRTMDAAEIGQLRGPCNSIPPAEIEAAARKWWRNARKAPLGFRRDGDRLIEVEGAVS